ncbi:hypothetical protein SS1G_07514 [Sclerotinia sclerotiorum 1980 UF-70]|uniref:Uncharacterized protein n=1 Tax=Sclerotinia sclerotiorum (strain ATCC 18683 / 1980 / Ss-1) TaxID=665079 RepID=A7EQB3_SCLS1|nr:hypothetical protein SS1G_07514 [Sclerotinia sclerotiorum 1980 UF-70]EDO05029.1 hypothetical protein SS1G_07514 [Sclerotinia sclerotiorum 1980 UF-70]
MLINRLLATGSSKSFVEPCLPGDYICPRPCTFLLCAATSS